jgi:hypothetical protein
MGTQGNPRERMVTKENWEFSDIRNSISINSSQIQKTEDRLVRGGGEDELSISANPIKQNVENGPGDSSEEVFEEAYFVLITTWVVVERHARLMEEGV